MNRADETSSKPFPESRAYDDHYLRFLSRLPDFRTSRRSVLKGLVGASAGMPLAGALARAASRFQVNCHDGRLAVMVGGLEAWVVDEHWFDGTPKLSVQRGDSHFDVVLERALFPGTSLSANFFLFAMHDGTQWTARLRIPALGFSSDFAFEPWLLGIERAQANATPQVLAFRHGTDLRLDWRDGVLTIGPDWIIDVGETGSALLRFDGQQVPLTGLRCELACPPRDALPQGRRLDLWPAFASDTTLRFPDQDRVLALAADSTRGYIRASMEFTELRFHGDTGHDLAWRAAGLADVHLPFQQASVSLYYKDGARTLAAQAAPAGRSWHEDAGLAAEFGMESSDTQVVLGSTDPPTAPRAHRFVVSLPGCDMAMFVRRQGVVPTQAPETYGAGLFDFAHRRIELDAYDLTLKRAADALALTVRFRHIRLVYTWRGWQLFSTSADSLIEFDFGSQHLLEEAVYISEWACVEPGCTPQDRLALPEEMVAAAILRNQWHSGIDSDSPVSATDLARFKEPDLPKFLDWLHEHAREKFNTYRSLARIRDALADPSQASSKTPIRVEYARPTHLTFAFTAPDGILLSVDNLLAWANPMPRNRRHLPNENTFVARLSARAQAINQRDFAGILPQDNDPDRPWIARPLSLADSSGEPAAYATALELPARLVMSPIVGEPVHWKARSRAFAHPAMRHEVWSVRLDGAKVRAIFTPDAQPVQDCTPAAAFPECVPCHVAPDRYQIAPFSPPRPFAGKAAACEFRTTLDARDRHELVVLSSINGLSTLCGSAQVACYTPDSGRYVALPIDAPKLQLTSLGASFRYQARWDPPAADVHAGADGALSVTRYDQHAQLGRDIDCRVEYKGFLFPLGHPAILVKLTERRFCLEVSAGGKLQMVARLVQRFFIRVPRFVRPFPAIGQPNGNRLWGHASILTEDLETPDLLDPTDPRSSFACLGQSAFTPRTLCGQLIEFAFGEPGTRSAYAAPLVFVDNNVAHSARLLKQVIEEWRRTVFPLLGNTVDQWPPVPAIGLASVKSGRLPFVAGMSNDHTELEVDLIVLDVQNRLDVQSGSTVFADQDTDSAFRHAQYDDYVREADYPATCTENYKHFSWFAWGVTAQMEAQRQPPFYPVRRRSRVRLGKLAALDGRSTGSYMLDYDSLYAEAGFDAARNAGQVFARFVAVAPTLDFSADTSRSGGFANPSTALVFYSAKRGPLGGRLEDLIALASGAYTQVGESTARPCLLPAATKQLAGTTVTTVTRHSAHAEQLVPEEFFSAFLGEAKLLGVVRIVDILHAALAGAGDMIPTINSEELFNLVEENLRPIAQSLQELVDQAAASLASDVPPAVAARLIPAMQAVSADLAALQGELAQRPADGARLLAVANRFGKDVGALMRSIEGVANEPQLFLPPKEAQVITLLQQLFDTLRNKDLRALMLARMQAALKEFIDARLAAGLEALLQAIEYEPRLLALRRRAESMLARLNALRAELEQVRDDALATIGNAFDELVALARQLATLRAVLEAQAQALVDGIQDAATELSDACRGVTTIQVDALRQLAAAAYGQIDAALATLEGRVPPDLRAAAAPPMAQARRAAAAFNASVDDQLSRLEALANGASLRQPDARLAAAGLAQAADYVLRIPELAIRHLSRASEMLDALIGFARVLDASDTAVTTWCMQQLAPFINAYDSILDGFRGRALNATRAAAFEAVLDGMKASAARLDTLAHALTEARLAPVKAFLCGLAAQLQEGAGQLEQACADLLNGTAASLFDTATACTAAGAAIGAKARDIQAAASAPLARLQEAGRELAQLQATIGGLPQSAREAIESVAATAADALVRAEAGLDRAETELNNTVVKPIVDQLEALPSTIVGGIKVSDYFSRELRDAVDGLDRALKQGVKLRGPQRSAIETALQRLLTLLAESLSLTGVGRLVDVQRILGEVQNMLGLPTRVRISYDWTTDVHAYPEGTDAIFEPLEDRKLEIHATVEAGLQGGPRTSMRATLSPFNINLFGSEATRFLTLTMDKLELIVPPGGKLECHTKVLMVRPGKALGFVQNLAAMLGFDSNFNIVPTFNGIFVSYTYASEYQLLGGFVLQNIAFSIGATLPFDNSPVRVEVKLSEKLKPFLISAGIYGGGGFFRIQTRADTVEVLEASFEYGFVGGFGYGVLSGAGRVTAGIYIKLGGKDAVIEGFFCAMGEVDIASLFKAGAALRVSLTYGLTSRNMAGVAEYTFSFSIGWFDYEYGVAVQYVKEGDPERANGNSQRAAARPASLPAAPAASASSGAATDAALSPQQWRDLWAAHTPAPPDGEGLHSACTPFCTAA